MTKSNEWKPQNIQRIDIGSLHEPTWWEVNWKTWEWNWKTVVAYMTVAAAVAAIWLFAYLLYAV